MHLADNQKLYNGYDHGNVFIVIIILKYFKRLIFSL